MKILILTVGTRGDVQPYLAVGKGLKASGHEVTVCTSESFEPFVVAHGLDYAHMNDELIEFIHSDDGKIAMERSGNWWEMLQTARRLLPKMGGLQRRQIDDMWCAVQNVSPDLILFHPKALAAQDFAQRQGIPAVMGFYLPMFVPTRDFPAMGFGAGKLGGWWNRLTYKLLEKATLWATAKPVNRWRLENGLPKRRGKYLRIENDAIPLLHAFSRYVIPQPEDWPETAKVTGYWFLDQLDDWRPSKELMDFLSAGDPPIYIGFGSISGRDPKRLTQLTLDAIEKTSLRAILCAGWGGLDIDSKTLPANVLGIEKAPHDWLFPRTSAVVHHGGCGTTAAGLRAGRPSLICPFFGDQPFWGSKIHELGLGPAPIPQRKLSVDNLAQGLLQISSDTQMRSKAERIGEQIRAEKGVDIAVRWINQFTSKTID